MLLVLIAGLVWIVVTGLLARSQLTAARDDVSRVRTELSAGHVDRARATLDSVARHADRAHTLTTGPAWWFTAALPWAGDPAQTLRGLTVQADTLAGTALPRLGDIVDELGSGDVRSGGRIDLSALAALTPDVSTASTAVSRTSAAVDRLPAHTWLPPLNRATTDVSGQIDALAGQLRSATTALQVLPPMLGATTPQRYFVAFQNNAEARGTGGLPGAFAIVTAVDGVVTFERFEPDGTLVDPLVDVADRVDFGAAQREYVAQYQQDLPFGDYRDSNESPHFPYAAQIWAAMWQKYSGETVTGAIAVDPTALGYLLRATGPVQLADGSELTSADIVARTQSQVYAQFPGLDNASIAARKDYLLDVAAKTERALLAPGTDTSTLVSGAARAATERRLLVWSSDPAVESVLAGTAVGGVVQETTQPYSQLVVLNVAGNKLDYYLDRSVSWTRTGCGDTRDVTVSITLRNDAPTSGLPAYVTFRADDPPAGTPVGSNRQVVDYFATDGALLTSITVDGQATTAQVYSQRGHPVFRTLLETAPGASHTVVLRLREPAGTAPLTSVVQPLVRPLVADTSDAGC